MLGKIYISMKCQWIILFIPGEWSINRWGLFVYTKNVAIFIVYLVTYVPMWCTQNLRVQAWGILSPLCVRFWLIKYSRISVICFENSRKYQYLMFRNVKLRKYTMGGPTELNVPWYQIFVFCSVLNSYYRGSTVYPHTFDEGFGECVCVVASRVAHVRWV